MNDITQTKHHFFENLVSACRDEPPPFADVCFIVDNCKFYGHKVRSVVHNNNDFDVSAAEGTIPFY